MVEYPEGGLDETAAPQGRADVSAWSVDSRPGSRPQNQCMGDTFDDNIAVDGLAAGRLTRIQGAET